MYTYIYICTHYYLTFKHSKDPRHLTASVLNSPEPPCYFIKHYGETGSRVKKETGYRD